MQTRRTARGAVRDRIDAADQAIMARLSGESSPVLDRFLPALSRSADFFVLWIGIAAAPVSARGRVTHLTPPFLVSAVILLSRRGRPRRDGVARRMTAPAYALSSSGVFVPGRSTA